MLVAWVTFGLAGCASTRHEAPPTVAPQPPKITTTEAVANAEVVKAQEAAASAPTEAAPAATAAPVSAPAAAAAPTTVAPITPQGAIAVVPATPAAPTPVVLATPSPTVHLAQRYFPTELSVEEILKENAATAPPLDFQQRVDHAHDRIYTWSQGLVEATDHKFAAKDREMLPVPAAPFRLGFNLQSIDHSDGVDVRLDVDLDIALSLPNIEKRFRIFITSDALDEAPRAVGDNPGLRAGLRVPLRKYLDFDVGLKLDAPPVAFASVKWTREVPLGDWTFYPFAKLFADTKESVGYALAATFDRWYGRNLYRSSSYAKWRADRDAIQWSQSFIYARANEIIVPERYGQYLKANDIGHGWGVRLYASGKDASYVDYYESGFFFRHPTSSHQWLFWFVEPFVRWDKDYNWDTDPGVRVGFNALFWDLSRPAR
ncbi:MAG: hypothetical protein ABI616_05685 [Pseudomonadota bacterium]